MPEWRIAAALFLFAIGTGTMLALLGVERTERHVRHERTRSRRAAWRTSVALVLASLIVSSSSVVEAAVWSVLLAAVPYWRAARPASPRERTRPTVSAGLPG
jgi:hypothetical protein